MNLSRKERQAHTRTCLMSSASKLFARRGLDQTSVDEVAQDAGYTKGAFYANFKSKEELFLVMLDEKFAAEIDRLERALQVGGEPREQAQRAGMDFVSFIHDDPEWTRLYFEFAAYAARNEEFRQELLTRLHAIRERMNEVFRRWSADFPTDPPFPIEELVLMTCFMTDGFLLRQLIDSEIPDELYGKMMLAFFVGTQALATGWEAPPTKSQAAKRGAGAATDGSP